MPYHCTTFSGVMRTYGLRFFVPMSYPNPMLYGLRFSCMPMFYSNLMSNKIAFYSRALISVFKSDSFFSVERKSNIGVLFLLKVAKTYPDICFE